MVVNMKYLPYYPNTSYLVPVAVGDIVWDVSCRACEPKQVEVVRLFEWGLWIRAADDVYCCERWER